MPHSRVHSGIVYTPILDSIHSRRFSRPNPSGSALFFCCVLLILYVTTACRFNERYWFSKKAKHTINGLLASMG